MFILLRLIILFLIIIFLTHKPFMFIFRLQLNSKYLTSLIGTITFWNFISDFDSSTQTTLQFNKGSPVTIGDVIIPKPKPIPIPDHKYYYRFLVIPISDPPILVSVFWHNVCIILYRKRWCRPSLCSSSTAPSSPTTKFRIFWI